MIMLLQSTTIASRRGRGRSPASLLLVGLCLLGLLLGGHGAEDYYKILVSVLLSRVHEEVGRRGWITGSENGLDALELIRVRVSSSWHEKLLFRSLTVEHGMGQWMSLDLGYSECQNRKGSPGLAQVDRLVHGPNSVDCECKAQFYFSVRFCSSACLYLPQILFVPTHFNTFPSFLFLSPIPTESEAYRVAIGDQKGMAKAVLGLAPR